MHRRAAEVAFPAVGRPLLKPGRLRSLVVLEDQFVSVRPLAGGHDFQFWPRSVLIGSGRARPLCPGISDINLFCYRERIINLNPEISDCTFDLGMAEKELYCS